jgi:hypothetical protein
MFDLSQLRIALGESIGEFRDTVVAKQGRRDPSQFSGLCTKRPNSAGHP